MIDVQIVTSTLGQPRILLNENITYIELLEILSTQYHTNDLQIEFDGKEIYGVDQFKSLYDLGQSSGCTLNVDIRSLIEQQKYTLAIKNYGQEILNLKMSLQEHIHECEQLEQNIVIQDFWIEAYDRELRWYKVQRQAECKKIKSLEEDIQYFLEQMKKRNEGIETLKRENQAETRQSLHFYQNIEDLQIRLQQSEVINQQLSAQIADQSLQYNQQLQEINNLNERIADSDLIIRELGQLNQDLNDQMMVLRQPIPIRFWNRLRDRFDA